MYLFMSILNDHITYLRLFAPLVVGWEGGVFNLSWRRRLEGE